jgi:hypothetical protein
MFNTAKDFADSYSALKDALDSIVHAKRDGVTQDGRRAAVANAADILGNYGLDKLIDVAERELRKELKTTCAELQRALKNEAA